MLDPIRQHRVAMSFDSHDTELSSSASADDHGAEVDASPHPATTPAASIPLIHPREGYFQHHALALSKPQSPTERQATGAEHTHAAARREAAREAEIERIANILGMLHDTMTTIVGRLGGGGPAEPSTPSGSTSDGDDDSDP